MFDVKGFAGLENAGQRAAVEFDAHLDRGRRHFGHSHGGSAEGASGKAGVGRIQYALAL